MIADALKNAAKRNVSVYLMADGYASKSLPMNLLTILKAMGKLSVF
jgi:phosphatidylserine/phosphatidylglycerophosphate/cardiolipin synthase-like enzyme